MAATQGDCVLEPWSNTTHVRRYEITKKLTHIGIGRTELHIQSVHSLFISWA
ncbi:hypothetical protein M378DRAFT_162452 [Amanita muscaria Koide BX008]|uniref:Uncharacterized protein n=1 Tax=Amanita muscaria (strain Koide BX008) TaxID=946122 RepID=A0A0C2WTW4_AMAMK|nr:hypothetical protein M378DRAFT_162452 [Amanita muscaria Koide BX008]